MSLEMLQDEKTFYEQDKKLTQYVASHDKKTAYSSFLTFLWLMMS